MRPTLSRLAVVVPAALLLALLGAQPAFAADPTAMTTTPNPTTTTAGTVLNMSDTATLTGTAVTPAGNVDFAFFNNDTCTGTPVFSGTAALAPTTGTSSAATFTFNSWTAVEGTYYWHAIYGGDANSDPVAGACNDTSERVIVSPAPPPAKATPTISGEADPQQVLEDEEVTLTDTATLSGANAPTGDIYFALFDNDSCDGDPVIDGVAPIVGSSATFTITVTPEGQGEYFWAVAYEGDANNEGVEGDCDDPKQLLVVAPNPANEPQEPGPLTPVSNNGEVTSTAELPRTGAPVGTLSLLGFGLVALGFVLVRFGHLRPVTAATAAPVLGATRVSTPPAQEPAAALRAALQRLTDLSGPSPFA